MRTQTDEEYRKKLRGFYFLALQNFYVSMSRLPSQIRLILASAPAGDALAGISLGRGDRRPSVLFFF